MKKRAKNQPKSPARAGRPKPRVVGPKPRVVGPKPKKMIVTTKSTVVKTTRLGAPINLNKPARPRPSYIHRQPRLGSSIPEHQERARVAAESTQAHAESFDQALSRGDCNGALRHLTEFARRAGQVEADRRGADQDMRSGDVHQQLASGEKRFLDRCARPKGPIRKFVMGRKK